MPPAPATSSPTKNRCWRDRSKRPEDRMREFRLRLAVVVALGVLAVGGAPRVVADGASLTVRITSPMGRTGVTGPVRIVAQVGNAGDTPLQSVKFFVNATLVGENHKGPVYAVEWSDDNPFEATEIRVEATAAVGHTAQDEV